MELMRSTINFKPSFVEKIFGQLINVEVAEHAIIVEGKKQGRSNYLYKELDFFPMIRKGIFFDEISLLRNQEEITIRGISKFLNKESYHLFVQKFSLVAIAEVKECMALYESYNTTCFLRDSYISPFDKKITYLASYYRCNASILSDYLTPEDIDLFKGMCELPSLEVSKDNIREKYERVAIEQDRLFFESVESNPLTKEQSLAVIRDNDRNLILAAAGTGKTSVMVAKALNIIFKQQALPEEILVLAFGNKAADEVNARIEKRRNILCQKTSDPLLSKSNTIKATTFHALGRKILEDSGQSVCLSKLEAGKDDTLKNYWFQRQLEEILHEDDGSQLFNFVDLQYIACNPFEFKTELEYERFLRDNDYFALSGDIVKSYQEVLIANWLYLHGIPFSYEPNYDQEENILLGFLYQPDFKISETSIYIEHFGIDRNGKTRCDIDAEKYNKGIEDKRQIHKQNQTTLVETFHYEWCEKTLLSSLEKRLSRLGVKSSPISSDEIFSKLQTLGNISEFAKIMRQAVAATRIEGLSIEDARQRLIKSKFLQVDTFIPFLDKLKSKYELELSQRNEIDFDDMISRAIDCVQSGSFMPSWKYILVDEFQDISQSRLDLVNSLLSSVNNVNLFAVGDDWQSIYRFSGGKLEITTRFEEIVGKHSQTKLQKTFRYNSSIAEVAGKFVMKNPEQYVKHVVTNEVVDTPNVFLLDTSKSGSDQMLENVISTIQSKDKKGSIAVLSRYKKNLKDAKKALGKKFGSGTVSFWSFHGSKGLEADYCVLIGFNCGSRGFPSEQMSYAAIEALLPTLDEFPYSEERRLMYVAITRAKKKCYILADPMNMSSFVTELLTNDYDVVVNSDRFHDAFRKTFKCVHCIEGYLDKRKGTYSDYYNCNSCHKNAKVCPKCGSPMRRTFKALICQSNSCDETTILCPLCSRPLKKRSRRKGGHFLGCSGYGDAGPRKCGYTTGLNPR